jgi:hypothetical protein
MDEPEFTLRSRDGATGEVTAHEPFSVGDTLDLAWRVAGWRATPHGEPWRAPLEPPDEDLRSDGS